MIIYLFISVVISLIGFLFGLLPDVVELPFGMDAVLVFFVQTVNSIIAIMPWFDIIWELILFAIVVEALFFLFYWIKYFIGLVRGSA